MKSNKMIATYLVLSACLLTAITISENVFSYPKSNSPKLSVEVTAPKQTYILGEKIELDFKVENQGREITGSQKPDAKCGYLRIQIANESKIYKDYFGSKWQTEDCEVVLPLKENEIFKSKETILWNVKPEVSHLNTDAANRMSKDRILTDYVFPKAGDYFIRTVLSFPNNIQPKITSEPMQITIEDPTGAELDVWNKIKDNGEIAYFIQEGKFITFNAKEVERLKQEVEEIAVKYPNSLLANQVEQSLDKFQANEAKRQESMQKLKVKQP